MGSIKQSESSKKQWANLNPKQRAKRMLPLTEARWKNVSKKKRKEHAVKMAEARWGGKRTFNQKTK